jgi:Uma2 family endonuclease
MADLLRKEDTYTYQDLLNWPGDERWELIDGHAYAMSPAPLFRHQKMVGSVHAQLFAQLQGKPCQVMVAPLDVRLTESNLEGKSTTHVVQPDVLIFCDPSKADEKGLTGAPDWVLEVLSDHTAWKDQTQKLALYERFGVREYWILNPETHLLLVHVLHQGKYKAPQTFLGPAAVSLTSFPELEVKID